jgi:hypothetical protein
MLVCENVQSFPFVATMFTVVYAESVANDLAVVRLFERRKILGHIDRQLAHQPTQETRNKKIVRGLNPPWDHVEPVWELRVDEYRVFYDVDEIGRRVVVRAVRRKPPHKTTEEIL